MKSSGKIYFLRTDKNENPKSCFSSLLEVNSNFDTLKTLHLSNGKSLGITSNNELLEWEYNKKQNIENSEISSKKNDFLFLLSKPSYRFHKIKIKNISLNKTMAICINITGNVFVWGENKDGLLGLGFDITSVDTPTLLENLTEINECSLSDFHAVVINNNGVPFSWGLGKYGELGLNKSIYSPFPMQMNTDSLYSKVFCGNLITCFLDLEGHFSYFGIVIKQLMGNNSTITVKNLLNDQSTQDNKSIFYEKEIEELEDQKFKNVTIGNGFIGLLSNTGTLFTLEYNDKLTMLYSKYYLYNIVVAKNEIYGLAKDNVKINDNNNLINNNSISQEEKIRTNYYLCKWNNKCSSENEVCSDIWNTTIWKFSDEFQNIISNCKLLDTTYNKNFLLLLNFSDDYTNTSVLYQNKKIFENDISLDTSVNNNNTTYDNLTISNNYNNSKKKFPEKILEFEADYDDSFNLKYKRTKAKTKNLSGFRDLSAIIPTGRSRSLSPFLNKTYNNIHTNTIPINLNNNNNNLNKSNFGINNIGAGNISGIALNTSGYNRNNSVYMNNINNNRRNNNINNTVNNSSNNGHNIFFQSSQGNIIQNTLSSNNNIIPCNILNNKNLLQNSKSFISINNDLSKDKDDLNISNNKNSNNNNLLEESIDVKERELNKYRNEIDDIINNYRNKQSLKKKNMINKYNTSNLSSNNIINKNLSSIVYNENSGLNLSSNILMMNNSSIQNIPDNDTISKNLNSNKNIKNNDKILIQNFSDNDEDKNNNVNFYYNDNSNNTINKRYHIENKEYLNKINNNNNKNDNLNDIYEAQKEKNNNNNVQNQEINDDDMDSNNDEKTGDMNANDNNFDPYVISDSNKPEKRTNKFYRDDKINKENNNNENIMNNDNNNEYYSSNNKYDNRNSSPSFLNNKGLNGNNKNEVNNKSYIIKNLQYYFYTSENIKDNAEVDDNNENNIYRSNSLNGSYLFENNKNGYRLNQVYVPTKCKSTGNNSIINEEENMDNYYNTLQEIEEMKKKYQSNTNKNINTNNQQNNDKINPVNNNNQVNNKQLTSIDCRNNLKGKKNIETNNMDNKKVNEIHDNLQIIITQNDNNQDNIIYNNSKCNKNINNNEFNVQNDNYKNKKQSNTNNQYNNNNQILNDQQFSSPAFNKGYSETNRITELLINNRENKENNDYNKIINNQQKNINSRVNNNENNNVHYQETKTKINKDNTANNNQPNNKNIEFNNKNIVSNNKNITSNNQNMIQNKKEQKNNNQLNGIQNNENIKTTNIKSNRNIIIPQNKSDNYQENKQAVNKITPNINNQRSFAPQKQTKSNEISNNKNLPTYINNNHEITVGDESATFPSLTESQTQFKNNCSQQVNLRATNKTNNSNNMNSETNLQFSFENNFLTKQYITSNSKKSNSNEKYNNKNNNLEVIHIGDINKNNEDFGESADEEFLNENKNNIKNMKHPNNQLHNTKQYNDDIYNQKIIINDKTNKIDSSVKHQRTNNKIKINNNIDYDKENNSDNSNNNKMKYDNNNNNNLAVNPEDTFGWNNDSNIVDSKYYTKKSDIMRNRNYDDEDNNINFTLKNSNISQQEIFSNYNENFSNNVNRNLTDLLAQEKNNEINVENDDEYYENEKIKKYLDLPVKYTENLNTNSNKNNKKNISNNNNHKFYSSTYNSNNKKITSNNSSMVNSNYNSNRESISSIKNKKKLGSVKMNKYSLTYFCFLITNYMKKKSYLMCVYEIANFQKTYEKNLALKLLFMTMKKRIIFYKIKFLHRFKKIHKYLIKYQKNNTNNISISNINNNKKVNQIGKNQNQYMSKYVKK